MITLAADAVWHDLIPGIQIRTLVHGDTTLMAQFRLEAGRTLPLHSHPHEQTGYLLSGRMSMSIGGVEHGFGPGDSWAIAGGVEHGAFIHETCLAIEVFCPLREDYLPYLPERK
jgi:quercetin dioxygenase-like cupin family protein